MLDFIRKLLIHRADVIRNLFPIGQLFKEA